jgi:uncharacterized delta-60 repeat protein
MKILYAMAVACSSLLFTLAGAWGAPGNLDPTFGNGGVVQESFGKNVRPADAALQPDGKLVIVGTLDNFDIASQVSAVLRYLPSGALDTSFGQRGLVIQAFTNFTNAAESVAIQSDGKIVILAAASSADGSINQSLLARFDADGSLDSTFGSGGQVIVNFPHPATFVTPASVTALQPDGRILVGGVVRPLGRNRHHLPVMTALARYNANGAPDTTFGTNGVAEAIAIGEPSALAVLSGGGILAVNEDAQSAQFTSNGTLLSSPVGGTVTATTHTSDSAFQPNAQFLVASSVRGPGYTLATDIQVRRFQPTGTVDPAFQTPLFKFGPSGPFPNFANTIVVAPGGKIVVAGGTQTAGGGQDAGVARLNANGSLDATFGNGGAVTTAFQHGGQVLAVVIQPDGKIVAIGQAFSNDTSIPVDLVLIRYLGQ